MTDTNESDDWVAGSTIEATAWNLTFFGGSSVPVDASRLPDPPNDPDVA
ncbi:MAG: hypothetical protein ACXV5U_00120 [Ilumatobacteraceae bacterium]